MRRRVLRGAAASWTVAWRTQVRRCSSVEAKCQPLDSGEIARLHNYTRDVSFKRPRLARVLLSTISELSLTSSPHPQKGDKHTELGVFKKTFESICQVELGKGKTKVFAYLSTGDKLRVLRLTGAEGASSFRFGTPGKTSFFSALPGEVKYLALQAWQAEREASRPRDYSPATPDQLVKVALTNGAPMLGFGFMDNFLMISFGESIDAVFGMYVSTMAAAALGNLCSNLVGLGLADYIEHAAERMGIPSPKLTDFQRDTRIVHVVGVGGTVIGVSVGCLLGMVPLLFVQHGPRTDAVAAEPVTESPAT